MLPPDPLPERLGHRRSRRTGDCRSHRARLEPVVQFRHPFRRRRNAATDAGRTTGRIEYATCCSFAVEGPSRYGRPTAPMQCFCPTGQAKEPRALHGRAGRSALADKTSRTNTPSITYPPVSPTGNRRPFHTREVPHDKCKAALVRGLGRHHRQVRRSRRGSRSGVTVAARIPNPSISFGRKTEVLTRHRQPSI